MSEYSSCLTSATPCSSNTLRTARRARSTSLSDSRDGSSPVSRWPWSTRDMIITSSYIMNLPGMAQSWSSGRNTRATCRPDEVSWASPDSSFCAFSALPFLPSFAGILRVTMVSMAWLGPHRPSSPRPTLPVRRYGYFIVMLGRPSCEIKPSSSSVSVQPWLSPASPRNVMRSPTSTGRLCGSAQLFALFRA